MVRNILAENVQWFPLSAPVKPEHFILFHAAFADAVFLWLENLSLPLSLYFYR